MTVEIRYRWFIVHRDEIEGLTRPAYFSSTIAHAVKQKKILEKLRKGDK
jgi:hypothetical protein